MAKGIPPKVKKQKEQKVEQAKVVPEYVQNKKYKWEPENIFSLTGIEFAKLINQSLNRKQELLLELEVLNILESKLKEAVSKGIAVEFTD